MNDSTGACGDPNDLTKNTIITGIAAAKAPKKKSLFERLAQGMGRQADAPSAHVEPALAPKSEARMRKAEAVQSVSTDEDDQLEIPAFLRRQAN